MDAASYDNIPAWAAGTPGVDLPSLQENLRADICVIGLGGSGLRALELLTDAGVKAVGIDAGEIAGGASGRNGGFLLAGTARFYHQTVTSLGAERASRLYRLTLAEIDRIHASTPEVVSRCGSLRIASSKEELQDCELQFDFMRRDDLPVERYAGAEGCGLLFPHDAAFNPLQRCRILGQRLLNRGVRLFEHSPAVEIGTGLITTPKASVACDSIIVALDGALDRVLPELKHRVRTARLQMLATAPTEEISVTRPVYARWGYEYWQQTADRRLVLGGFRDFGGDDEWTHSTTPTERIQRQLEQFLREKLAVRAPITHRWAAPVGYTANALPIIEEARPRIWAIGGYNGTGNVVGSLCAQAVTERIVAGASELSSLFNSPD